MRLSDLQSRTNGFRCIRCGFDNLAFVVCHANESMVPVSSTLIFNTTKRMTLPF